MKSKKSNRWSNWVLTFGSVLFCLILIEITLSILAEKGKIHINRPAYSFGQVRHRFWADINPDFGVWHEPHSHYHQSKSCYEVDYDANSYGARDIERKVVSENPRVLVLGDSFVEGFGVAEEKRFTDLLEKQTGEEYLNFGTAGAFGPTQYYLLYKTLAKKFSHDTVLVAILPFNDFLENDIEFGKKAYPYRYRPYFVGNYPQYQLVYHLKEGLESPDTPQSPIIVFFRSYSYIFNALERVVNSIRHRMAMPDPTGEAYSGYYDYTPAQWDLLKYDLEKIKEEAQERKMVVVTMPVQSDFIRYQKGRVPPLISQLSDLSSKEGFVYLDLLEEMAKKEPDWKKFYLVCDNHWNNYGHQVASEILREKIAFIPSKSGDSLP